MEMSSVFKLSSFSELFCDLQLEIMYFKIPGYEEEICLNVKKKKKDSVCITSPVTIPN